MRSVSLPTRVELDDLLDDGPVQHRETQGNESPLFQSYFSGIQYLQGGIASGFRTVKPEEYKPRLFQVRRTKKSVRAFEVPVKASSLNKGDTFVLDAGLKIYTFIGEESNAFEKMKGGALAHNLISARQGKAKRAEPDADFWKLLGGSDKDVGPANHNEEEEKSVDPENCTLFRLSDASGHTTFTKEASGKISLTMFDTNDVFILDANVELFIWVGKGATKNEKSQAFKHADEYIKKEGRPATLPITQINEGQVNLVFAGCVNGKLSLTVCTSTNLLF